ncbi:MAG: hypothetical protein ACPLRP_05290 [Candidatus Bipolaricaulaceae bacterium]
MSKEAKIRYFVAGIAITLGVLVHILLHWRWLIHMTTNLFKSKPKEVPVCPEESGT